MFFDLATLPTYHHYYQIDIEQSTPSREGQVTEDPKSSGEKVPFRVGLERGVPKKQTSNAELSGFLVKKLERCEDL